MSSREQLNNLMELREITEDGKTEIGVITELYPADFAALRELDQLLADFVHFTPDTVWDPVKDELKPNPLIERSRKAGY